MFNSAQNRHSRHVQTRRELHIEHQKQLQGQIYPGHIPLNWFQTALMTVGSAFMSLADPRRGGKLPLIPLPLYFFFRDCRLIQIHIRITVEIKKKP